MLVISLIVLIVKKKTSMLDLPLIIKKDLEFTKGRCGVAKHFINIYNATVRLSNVKGINFRGN